MKERELLSLPLGEYKLYNDDNFNKNKFNLRIYFCDSMKQRRYIIQESMNLNGATFHLYETEDYVFEDQRRDGYFKKKHLSASASFKGLSVLNGESYWVIRNLQFLPKSSYLSFINFSNNQTKTDNR